MTRVVEPITSVCLDAVRDYVERLPHLSVDWDTSRDHEQRVALQMYDLELAVAEGEGWMTWSEGKVDGVLTLRPLAWDSSFFGEPMAIADFFRAGNEDAGAVLLHQLVVAAGARDIRHIRHVVDVREAELVHNLQNCGWRYIWVCTRMVCDTRSVQHAPFSVSVPEVSVAETMVEHLPELLRVSETLPPYSWPDFDRSLADDARSHYAATRLRNCVEGDFADRCLTLLHRGRPIGFNASKIQNQPNRIPNSLVYSVERDLFISPQTIPGLGPAFQKEVVRRLADEVQFMIGQVRVGGLAMAHTVDSAGFRPWGGNVYMVLRLN